MSSIKLLAALLLLPLAVSAEPTGTALSALLAQAGTDTLPAAPAAPTAVTTDIPSSRTNFCASNLYTYQDRPVSAYELTCRNAALGLVLRQATSFDQLALFAPGGRCSPKHSSTISLRSAETGPFELAHETAGASEPAGRRELVLYRDDASLKPGQFLLNLTWVQGGDSYQLGYNPETRGTPSRVFSLVSGKNGEDSFTLKASALPFTFATSKTIDGKPVAYRSVPVDCEMTISVDGWYGR
ncbi:MAG TPA: hypothetical protein VN915_08620 [Elusimicrobiota bacterium]|nr:hypothetical protein [Elusimicrobiota bacterium]